MANRRFIGIVRHYHTTSGRHELPWRKTRDPYEILVSEVMLQQTQVARVLRKWPEFLAKFPTAEALAKAPVADVLKAWQGLGYNRRALALKRAAEAVVRDHSGRFPKDAEALEALPGVGQSTRGAILAFAFGIPTAFIETNVRAVFLHHFFPGKAAVPDRDILPLVEETLDKEDPRTWYYALMDYGVHLKQTLPNPSRASKHHARQSPFKGSNREVRSRILRFLLEKPRTEAEIARHIGETNHDVARNVADLEREGFISSKHGRYAVRTTGK